MHDEQSTSEQPTVTNEPATLAPGSGTEPEDRWAAQDLIDSQLPPRPRRRLLAPLPVGLLCVLLTACGFIGGVLVEKGETTTSSASSGAAGLASRLGALRSGASGGGGRGAGGIASLLGGGAGSSPGASSTVGQVAYIRGNTLYVTSLEGNTIKVTATAGTNVTRTIKSSAKAIHPGEMVIVTGSTGADGSVRAQSIRASEAGGGGLGAALFGGGGSHAGFSRAVGGGEAGGGEGPALFGKG